MLSSIPHENIMKSPTDFKNVLVIHTKPRHGDLIIYKANVVSHCSLRDLPNIYPAIDYRNDYGRSFFKEEGVRKKVEELFVQELRRDPNRPGAGVTNMVHSRPRTGDASSGGGRRDTKESDPIPGFQYSFTDLAQIVSQIKTSSSISISESGDGDVSSCSKEDEDEEENEMVEEDDFIGSDLSELNDEDFEDEKIEPFESDRIVSASKKQNETERPKVEMAK